MIGAAALNQAIKAIAIAHSFVVEDDIDLVCVPTFHTLQVGGEDRTAIRLMVEDRSITDGERRPVEAAGVTDV